MMAQEESIFEGLESKIKSKSKKKKKKQAKNQTFSSEQKNMINDMYTYLNLLEQIKTFYFFMSKIGKILRGLSH